MANDNDENEEGVPLTASAGIYMDEDIYGDSKSKIGDYVTSIAANDEADADVSTWVFQFYNVNFENF